MIISFFFEIYLFQVVNTSTTSTTSSTTSRVAKTSQRVHHVQTSEMKANALKRDLNEIKSSMSEINNLVAPLGRPTPINDLKLSNSTTMSQLQQR